MSFRYVETLEHPPIMDFYRNMDSLDVEGGMVARPSMLELLHGGVMDGEKAQEFREFKVRNSILC